MLKRNIESTTNKKELVYMGKTNRVEVEKKIKTKLNIRLGHKLYCYDCNNFKDVNEYIITFQ